VATYTQVVITGILTTPENVGQGVKVTGLRVSLQVPGDVQPDPQTLPPGANSCTFGGLSINGGDVVTVTIQSVDANSNGVGTPLVLSGAAPTNMQPTPSDAAVSFAP